MATSFSPISNYGGQSTAQVNPYNLRAHTSTISQALPIVSKANGRLFPAPPNPNTSGQYAYIYLPVQKQPNNISTPKPASHYKKLIDTMPGINRMPAEIYHALILLGQIRHKPGDEAHMQNLGVDLLFRNGEEALKVILDNGIKVEFGDMGDTKAHAQWLRDDKLIMINQKYKGRLSKDTLYAISEAIYHEAGHATRLGDNRASIQEEINCLALNTLAHRYHSFIDKDYQNSHSNSRLITDGVALYARLFFSDDLEPLVNRIVEKYGSLPPETPDHNIPQPYGQATLADQVCRQVLENDFDERLAALEEAEMYNKNASFDPRTKTNKVVIKNAQGQLETHHYDTPSHYKQKNGSTLNQRLNQLG